MGHAGTMTRKGTRHSDAGKIQRRTNKEVRRGCTAINNIDKEYISDKQSYAAIGVLQEYLGQNPTKQLNCRYDA